MKIIQPSFENISRKDISPYQFIERIGRKCYKSEDKITEDSAVKFVKGLVNSKHLAMVEHYWVHLVYEHSSIEFHSFVEFLNTMSDRVLNHYGGATDVDKFMQITEVGNKTFVSMPLRVVIELLDMLKDNMMYSHFFDGVVSQFPDLFPEFVASAEQTNKFVVIADDDEFSAMIAKTMANYKCSADTIVYEVMKHKTHTVLFICDRGVSHELVRHRPCSFAQESTRYCNYQKGKFGGEISVIEPSYLRENKQDIKYQLWREYCKQCEDGYFNMLNMGCTPQEAIAVLPNSLKTEIIMTANELEWQHIVDLRAKGVTGAPHPQMIETMTPWYEELKKLSKGRIR